jgi:hypothetical protein
MSRDLCPAVRENGVSHEAVVAVGPVIKVNVNRRARMGDGGKEAP